MRDDLTLVLDIGKSHAKLLFIDDAGEVVERHGRDNHGVAASLGYRALDVDGLAAWITRTLRGSAATRRCRRAIASTHGAAFVALGDDGLAWAPLDYEDDGVDALHAAYQRERDPFETTLSPDLPLGLNAARQLHWLQHTHPEAWARTRLLLPYPQYWAWWLSGVAASEVSSLGCHTQLWQPRTGGYAPMATRLGWAHRFAPLRPAWQVLGRVQPPQARSLGLPEDCEVVCGVHDSNACLARYLDGSSSMTLVSSGTWVVVMAPGGTARSLDPSRDELANVSVRGDVVPTARFMGGREVAALCDGADPASATLGRAAALDARGIVAMPSFAAQGGPYAGRTGQVLRAGRPIDAAALAPADRATLAAVYAAQLTAQLLESLGAPAPVVLEGPFADNPVLVHVLAALLPEGALHTSADPVEGTARGAWQLARRDAAGPYAPRLRAVATPADAARWRDRQARWTAALAAPLTS